MQQTTRDRIVVGHDTTSAFVNQTHFVALNGVPAWLAFEQLGVSNEIPMVRVSLSPVYTAQPVDAPAPAPATEADYIVLAPGAAPPVGAGTCAVPAAARR
jgi:hypothetical protein